MISKSTKNHKKESNCHKGNRHKQWSCLWQQVLQQVVLRSQEQIPVQGHGHQTTAWDQEYVLGADFKNNQSTKQLNNFIWTKSKIKTTLSLLPIGPGGGLERKIQLTGLVNPSKLTYRKLYHPNSHHPTQLSMYQTQGLYHGSQNLLIIKCIEIAFWIKSSIAFIFGAHVDQK